MMTGNKLGIITLVLVCSYGIRAKEGPMHKSDIEQLKQQRQFNQNHFYHAVKDLQNCVRMSNNISSQVDVFLNTYQAGVEKVKNQCPTRSIISEAKFQTCLSAQYSLLATLNRFNLLSLHKNLVLRLSLQISILS